MDMETFAGVTRRVIASDGFDDFLPTACYPVRREFAVLKGVPASIDIERATLNWASRKAEGDEEFLVAFKSSHDCFKIVRRAGHITEEAVYSVADA